MSLAYTLNFMCAVSSTQSKDKAAAELSESRTYSHSPGTPYPHSPWSAFFKWLQERISFSEPGRAVSEWILIDFEVVAVGNASHR